MNAELGKEARSLDERPLVLLERFHGHLGPYVVLGYRTGRLAREELGVNAFKLTAEVSAGRKPPKSCFVDGVQLGSGCTLGKGNITARDEQTMTARFQAEGGQSLTIKVVAGVLDELGEGLSEEHLVRLSRALISRPAEELFEVERGSD